LAEVTERKVLKGGLEGDFAEQKDVHKIEDIKKLINALKRHYDQVQVGMNNVRKELFEVKSIVERIEKVI